MSISLRDVRAHQLKVLLPPASIMEAYKLSVSSAQTVLRGRKEIEEILSGSDNRLLVIMGPCSIHDPKVAFAFAERLLRLRQQYADKLCVIMRVYFEKPRTIIGWKGLINDPNLDDSFQIDEGRALARGILSNITDMGLPAATEFLDTITPQFLADLVSWVAVGARTVESPEHRQMASGLSTPVGFKNGTSGSAQTAVDAIRAAQSAHHFAGYNEAGEECLFRTDGNPWGHLVLRGTTEGPNFDRLSVASASSMLSAVGLTPRILIDCSHANAQGNYKNQSLVMRDVVSQRNDGATAIKGVMIESNINPGKQNIAQKPLQYGVSITDGCIGWEESEALLSETYHALKL